jgi:CBS domain-containing protein
MPIGDYCQRDVLTARPGTSAREAAEEMRRRGVGCLVVVHRGHPAGIVTDRDLALRILPRRLEPESVKLEEVMTKPVITIPESARVAHASRVMRSNELRRLPVVDAKGRLVGIVTSDDLLALVSTELAQLRTAIALQRPKPQDDPAALRDTFAEENLQ